MDIYEALTVALKTLMADGGYNQDQRAQAYDVLMSHKINLPKPKTVFTTMKPRPLKPNKKE